MVPAKYLKDRCDSGVCKKYGKECFKINNEQRKKIFELFYNIGDLYSQREFLARHLEVRDIKRTTTKNVKSRRQHTILYKLTLDDKKILVCKKLFLNTLGITEKICRTVLSKVHNGGVLERDKRGGRQRSEIIKQKELDMNDIIHQHISRFPKVESHYCRSKTSKMYLHPDLSLSKMYAMYVEELQDNKRTDLVASFSLYRKIFKSKNLSFFRPKKDQCSLCVSYHNAADEKTKNDLKNRYSAHIAEKEAARELKSQCKKKAIEDDMTLCGVFDLQQVIYLPISKESAIFYKSRLSNFNFTFYDLATRECFCFIWNEAISKRGSSEIATCIFRVIEDYHKKSIKNITLFSDGCLGQNKNSIIPAMLMYCLNKFLSLETISIRYFETSHGQNEGDAAHSAIATAISTAGNIYVPSQLHPIVALARRKQPYKVIPLKYNDFLDFKSFSKEIRILSIKESENGKKFKWPDIKELMLNREFPTTLFFKTSHLDKSYDSIILKRLQGNLVDIKIDILNKEPPKVAKRKYDDLISLCSGETPVVRLPEFQNFYKSLNHETI